MVTCDRCGAKTRVVHPVMAREPGGFPSEDTALVIPRIALTEEENAAIPIGEHPDDGKFENWCEACSTGVRA